MDTAADRDRPDEGFFALRTGPPPAAAVPLARVYEGGSPALRERIAAVNHRLRVTEPRVGASIAFLGLAARLWSVSLVAPAFGDALPDLRPARLHWDPAAAPGSDLWLPDSSPPPGFGPAHPLRHTVLAAHLTPLVSAVRGVVPVAERLLWGNAASALAGAVSQLSVWCRERGIADPPATAVRLAADLLAAPELSGTGTLHGGAFRRRTCCLYYRAPGGGLCGDCVFATPPSRSPAP
ncbi:(2Fe-2S)-binding protein [Streptomyces sp. 549]|uniref:(2Fe-2S)-binding protein n=1 Tax=Streptomyces sp. 549 TaxID=3049076 RepID=UPI0024C3DBAC|nr:(2Fe-2S)-binding protein [Streptomyces sp. 549]MDK1471982.1 (2Fe-2S)-binding protein [Streptomyces sp. 549]